MHQVDIKQLFLQYRLDTFLRTCDAVSVALPVYCDLPVQVSGEGNPGDGAIIVVGVNTTEGHHTALLRVSTKESKILLIN